MTSVRFGLIRPAAAILCLFSLMTATSLRAQFTAGASPGLNAALVRLFGGVTAFTAEMELRMTDTNGTVNLHAPMRFSLLDGKMRGDLDVTKLKAKELPALAATAASSVGMDRVITLVRPDKQESYLLYPKFHACVVAPLDDEDLEALKQPAKLEKTPLGKETIEGHPCIKAKVVVTAASGRKHLATVWDATDLKGFPVQIQTRDGADLIQLRFRQVRFERPAAKEFDLPAGTARYTDASELTQAVMKNLLTEALGK